jgi:sulfur-oxidizing protein SoxA
MCVTTRGRPAAAVAAKAAAVVGALAMTIALALASTAAPATAQSRAIAPADLRSGIAFVGADVRALQADDAANPGFLWVERGARLWAAPAGTAGQSCASCHGDAATSMRGVAARYPAVDATSGQLLDLDARIADCRARRQRATPLPREDEDLLALSAYVARQARGAPLAVAIDGAARSAFERGRAFYYQRRGQMNLACADCHERNFGRRLLNETISQGQPNGFPAYRFEWQALGSLDRRLRACLFGVRAQVPPPGDPVLVELALFLGWRGGGLPVEAPGVRR